MQPHPRSESAGTWGHPLGWLAVLAGGALALRIVGLAEAPRPNGAVVEHAWAAVHGGSRLHGGFVWLLAPSQAWHAASSYEAARIVVVVAAVLGVGAAFWLGRAAYGTAAAFVAAAAVVVDTAHAAASREAVAMVPLTTLAAVALALLVAGRIELGAVAIGLAAAVDQAGWILLVPLVAVAWGRWRRLALAAAVVAVLSAPAWLDLHGVTGGHEGWPSLLWHGLGPALALSLAGLAGAAVLHTRADRALGSFVLAYGIFLVALPAHPARYTLPLVPALGALAGRFRSLAPVALLLLVLPLTWSIRDARELTRHSASTMGGGETAGSPHRPPGGAGAARLRLLGRQAGPRGGP